MIQERSYSSSIFFGMTIFSEHFEKENMTFRAVQQTKSPSQSDAIYKY